MGEANDTVDKKLEEMVQTQTEMASKIDTIFQHVTEENRYKDMNRETYDSMIAHRESAQTQIEERDTRIAELEEQMAQQLIQYIPDGEHKRVLKELQQAKEYIGVLERMLL